MAGAAANDVAERRQTNARSVLLALAPATREKDNGDIEREKRAAAAVAHGAHSLHQRQRVRVNEEKGKERERGRKREGGEERRIATRPTDRVVSFIKKFFITLCERMCYSTEEDRLLPRPAAAVAAT